MTKKEFMEILNRSVESIADGGQAGIEDVLTISKVLGGVDLERMTETERGYYLYGAQAGFEKGSDLGFFNYDWEGE
mgnify:CR=1 FL=1|jgi:hypothetical protein